MGSFTGASGVYGSYFFPALSSVTAPESRFDEGEADVKEAVPLYPVWVEEVCRQGSSKASGHQQCCVHMGILTGVGEPNLAPQGHPAGTQMASPI